MIWIPKEDPRTPESSQSKLEGIKDWLEEQLGGEVDIYRDNTRRVTCFRVEGLTTQAEPVLRVTDEALDDLGLETILEDLDQQQVPEKLLAHPTIHRIYTTERRIRDYETLLIRCDNRPHLVMRNEQGDIKILDGQDHPLPNLPQEICNLSDSVFMRTEQDWCYDIQRSRSNAPGGG